VSNTFRHVEEALNPTRPTEVEKLRKLVETMARQRDDAEKAAMEWKVERDDSRRLVEDWVEEADRVKAERDAAQVEVLRLREALGDLYTIYQNLDQTGVYRGPVSEPDVAALLGMDDRQIEHDAEIRGIALRLAPAEAK
jgi:uncharacterized coiled-coil DUF342 family protein